MSETHGAYNLDLFDSPPVVIASQAPGGYRALALAELHRHAADYPPEFTAWLKANWSIWTRFCRLADEVRSRREHYSARALFHHIRLESILREKLVVSAVVPQFKLNNIWSPSMARLYNQMSPCRADFFHTREAGG